MKSKADLILHPVRLKLIQTLVGGRQLTVGQMAERLPEVPQATLYRHLNLLRKGGLLVVVDQKQIRGAVERVYALADQGESLTEEDLKKATPQDHMQYFLHFLAGLINDFGTYLEGESIDPRKDGLSYRQASFFASDEELLEFIAGFRESLYRMMDNEPTEARRKRILTTILLPDKQ
ncbi:helix-turn-helix domain-containing protein [Paenibacillus silviterrae]|uniref:helix-turn-helix domain-containing protein n=1 Tax=Paenibacillus silviterrae TaxID=3242194 RepID=UPI002543D756|nr:helix-turn-helix domain-containing protein [Paenibacillus chinjuensis]